MKKIIILVISLIMIMTSSISALEMSGIEENNYISISNSVYDKIFEEIRDIVLYKYGDLYSFDNFSYEIENERIDGDDILVDIDIFTEMTLTKHPLEGQLIKSMNDKIALIANKAEKEYLQNEVDKIVKEVEELYYDKKDDTLIKYTVRIENANNKNVIKFDGVKYSLYYRTDVTYDKVILEPVKKIIKINSDKEKINENAENAISSFLSSFNKITASSFTYDRLAARDYAIDHATDEPEFSKANKQGSDCANFVSKALNAGGIPTDKKGKWYPSTDGTTATCGTNWMRTGYYAGMGGVVPYMVDKEYFYEQSDESKVYAGSIMYWNDESHVALVTYGDTVKIKYSQHSNVKLSEKKAVNVLYESDDVSATFYMPSSTIME